MNRRTLYKLLFIPLIVFCFGIILIRNTNVLAHADEYVRNYDASNNSNDYTNFMSDSVIVVLDSSISRVNKEHDASFFKEIEIETIEDLTRCEDNFNAFEKNFKQILKIVLKNKSKENVLLAIEKLERVEGILSVEPNYYHALESIPSDPYYESGQLWGLGTGGGIQASAAWEITSGSDNIRVGIIDTGISNHVDLNANLREGYDTFNDNTTTTDDTHSHGTHVAGTVGAVGNNSIGVVGVNWSVQLVPLQASNTDNKFYSDDVVEAITWASSKWGTNEQIDIINYSVAGLGRTTAVREAVRNYQGLFIWASGNDGEDIDARVVEYGSFDLPNLISVGSIGDTNERSSFSNYSTNNKNVNIYAPGESIVSTGLDNSYISKSGTSMAAPHVTGVAALMLSANPNLSGAELKSAIIEHSDTITISIPDGSGGTTSQTVKKLNAYKAVHAISKSYTITLNLGYNTANETTTVTYKDIVDIDSYDAQYVANRTGYDFHGFFSGQNGTGVKYFDYEIAHLEEDYYKLVSTGQTWNSTSDGVLYAHWTILEVNYQYDVVISNADEANKSYTIYMKHGTTTNITAPTIDGYTFVQMNLNGSVYQTTSYSLANTQLKRDLSSGIIYLWYPSGYGSNMNQGGLSMVYEKNEDSCVAPGTLITLADGRRVPVETLTGNELLLVWNLKTGTFDTAPIVFIDSEPTRLYNVITLHFSDGTQVEVIGEHGFWDFNINKYVYLGTDASRYIGHWFNKQMTDESGNFIWGRVQLTNVVIQEKYTTAWSPVTYNHLCYYVNGMLSMPGGISGLFNIFDVDSETMMYIPDGIQADIDEYGLFTYEEFNELFPITQETFEAFNGKYLKVAIGKGLITYEGLETLIERYQEYLV